MRIGMIADLQSNMAAAEGVLDDFIDEDLDEIVLLGVLGFGPNPAESLDFAQRWGTKVVKGSFDRAVMRKVVSPGLHPRLKEMVLWTQKQLSYDDFLYLNNLPYEVTIESPSSRVIGVYNEFQRHQMNLQYDEESWQQLDEILLGLRSRDILLVGNTAQGMVYSPAGHGQFALPRHKKRTRPFVMNGEAQVIAVPSAGLPRERMDKRANYIIINTETREITVHKRQYERTELKKKIENMIVSTHLKQWLIQIHTPDISDYFCR
jgi:predicted phosphodiesterase